MKMKLTLALMLNVGISASSNALERDQPAWVQTPPEGHQVIIVEMRSSENLKYVIGRKRCEDKHSLCVQKKQFWMSEHKIAYLYYVKGP